MAEAKKTPPADDLTCYGDVVKMKRPGGVVPGVKKLANPLAAKTVETCKRRPQFTTGRCASQKEGKIQVGWLDRVLYSGPAAEYKSSHTVQSVIGSDHSTKVFDFTAHAKPVTAESPSVRRLSCRTRARQRRRRPHHPARGVFRDRG